MIASIHSSLKVLCAFDKFKGSLEASKVCEAISQGLKQSEGFSSLQITALPLSDGGDGFLSLLASNLSLKLHPVDNIVGPLGERQSKLNTAFAASEDGSFAVIEMASAAGLALIPSGTPLDVANATTYGVGQLLHTAYQRGARHIVLGLGGSATNDAGLGALQALGLRIFVGPAASPLDADHGHYACGRIMRDISKLELPPAGLLPDLHLKLACDVTNPFIGPRGAVAVFSPQKGATDPLLRTQLEEGMVHVAKLFAQLPGGKDVSHLPGAGAAGGIAGGLAAVFHADIVSGMDLMAQCLHLEEQISMHDLIITGEGAFDASSDDGKVVSRVLQLAAKHQKPVVIVCGQSKHPNPPVPIYSLLAMFDLETAMQHTESCLQKLAFFHAQEWFQFRHHLSSL